MPATGRRQRVRGTTILLEPNPRFTDLVAKPQALLAFGFGSGLSTIMPGTAGTLAAVPIYYALSFLPWWAYLIVVIASCIYGVYICELTSKWLRVHDHRGIVWDEFAGFWITMFLAPPGWQWLLLGFVFFRFFDMLKPWPISLADKHIHGGFGIMFDDILAGLAAFASLQLCAWYWFQA